VLGGTLGGVLCLETGPFDIVCIAGGRLAGRAVGDLCEGLIIQMTKRSTPMSPAESQSLIRYKKYM
jgi:hypothetical protein